MLKITQLKVFYYLTKGPKYESIYKTKEPFFTKYTLEPDQTNINLKLIKRIMALEEINVYDIIDYRYFNEKKNGYVKITQRTSFPIISNEITLLIKLKDPQPQEIRDLIKLTKSLKYKLKEFENIKNNVTDAFDKKKIDLYFLYALPMEEIKGCDVNYIIAYHLEIAKICNIFENSKKSFNAIFESANELRLKDVLRKMPKVIHISCHGLNPSGASGFALRFEEKGKRQDIYEKQLDELLGKFEDQLKCIDLVFLSSCHSEVAGKLFKKHGAKNVIYIDKNWPVSNTASLDFAISFYQNLVNCKSVRDSFEATKKELDEKEKINYKNNIKCCCNSHSSHRKDTCLLSDPKKREEIHKEFHEKICECKNNEFCMHEDNCTLLNAVKKFNRNKKNKNGKKFYINSYNNKNIICCGCDKDKKDLHHYGESFKFIYESQDEKSGDIIIYGDNKEGKFIKNKNCFIVKDKEAYKNSFLMLIERRDYVRKIYEIIEDTNSDKNSNIHFMVIYGEEGVGKYNFASSVYIYLFERNIIKKCYSIKARSIDRVKSEIESKKNKGDDKYMFIIEIDNELQTPINLVNEILNENSILDGRFYYFILLSSKQDKIEIEQNQEKAILIHLEHLSDEKALQLIIELKSIYKMKTNYLKEEQLKELIKLVNNSRKEMYPLLKLIQNNNKFEDLKAEVEQKVKKKKKNENEIKNFLETKDGKLIFILYMMNKGLPSSVLKLFDPEFENIIQNEKIFYQANQNIWKMTKSEINTDDINSYLELSKRKYLTEKCLEICTKLLFHFLLKMHKNFQKRYFKILDIEYYYDYFFENKGFWKTFNDKIYEECFIKDENYSDYENIIKNSDINLEDIKDNIFNLVEVNNINTIQDLYTEKEKTKEYIEQIIIMLPRLFIKDDCELKKILNKCENFIKNKLRNLDNKKNLLRLNLFSLWLKDPNEINLDDFDNLDEGKAYANFIFGLKYLNIISKFPVQEPVNKVKKMKFNKIIDQAKFFFKNANELFKNNNMKAYCFYHLGNLECEQKKYEEAKINYINGKEIVNVNKFIIGLLNLKLAKLIINNIPKNVDNKEKFKKIIKELLSMDDSRFVNEAEQLQKEMEEKLLPDIVLLSSNPFISESNFTLYNNNIQASHNNQYYLMDKISKRKDKDAINSNLIIKNRVLNEENLREAFSGRGKILIIQSDDFNENGDILLESHIGKSYSLSHKYFEKINKINYDILILCYINSGKCLLETNKKSDDEIQKKSRKKSDKQENEKCYNLKNKIKYLITFDDSCSDIFIDIGKELYLEYNRLSIDFLDHFIYNVTKQDVQHAFEQAYNTFKTAFNRFCKQKSNSSEYEKLNYITLTVNTSRVKKIERIIEENGKRSIQFTPYPLLDDIPEKFSYFTKYSNDIHTIIKAIMENYEHNYIDLTHKKNKSILFNIYGKNDKSIQFSKDVTLNSKQLICLEIRRFCFRHNEIFNPSLFKYFKDIKPYLNNEKTLEKMRKENSSGLGLIIINVNKIKNLQLKKQIPGFLYIYLSKELMYNCSKHFEITNKINENEINNIYSTDSSNVQRRTKKAKSNCQKKNSKSYNSGPNSSSGQLNLKKNDNNSVSKFTIYEHKIKEYKDNELGSFDVIDYEEIEEDKYFSDEDKV